MDGMYAAGETRLNISDIQHYSTGDGDGIRTTVFFKGCNLRCPWCHNPETLSFLPQRLREGNRERLCGRWMAVEEVLEEILWDVDFYRESGGGATLSGGEVLLQAAGAAELCRRLRERGISVVIDTAGDVPYSAFAPLNRLGVEYFYDWKACPAEYERVIGGNPVRIYENLARLVADGQRVRVRVPLIPGLNDAPEYIAAMSEPLLKARVTSVELLPFHRLGSAKYAALGLEYPYKNVLPPTRAEIAAAVAAYAEHFAVTVGG